jgi:hypothetical protein
MKVIEITEGKLDNMSGLVEDMLTAGGKLMLCLEKLSNEIHNEKRNDTRYRMDESMYDNRRGMRYQDEDMWDERRYGNRYK